MPCRYTSIFICLVSLWYLLPQVSVYAQEQHTDYAWKQILEHEGVTISYIFYSTNEYRTSDGVVLRLANANTYAVTYQFTVIFKSENATYEEEACGELEKHEIKTGELDGLFWMPFPDGESIIELGLKGYVINRKS